MNSFNSGMSKPNTKALDGNFMLSIMCSKIILAA